MTKSNEHSLQLYPSFLIQAKALIYINALLGCTIIAIFLPIIGLFYHPIIVYPCVIIPYITYNFFHRYELKDGKPWRYFSENFPVLVATRSHLSLEIAELPKELVEAEKKKDAQFLIACFPHGTGSDFRVLLEGMLPQIFPNIYTKCRTLAASVLFMIPIIREISLWSGCIDARRSVAEKTIDRGRTIIVLPGGEMEQIRTRKGREIIYIKKRKGFIKLAMKKNIPVIPVYVFGASDLYETSTLFYKFRYWLTKTYGVCMTMSSGMLKSSCPFPVKNTIVMGKPLIFKMQGGEPTPQELDKSHLLFCEALKALFDNNKSKFGYSERTLEME